jgi:hypothetical protein
VHCSQLHRKANKLNVDPLDSYHASSRLRDRLSEPAMLDLTKTLIAIPSENPPGKRYEECACALVAELNNLKFDDVRREGQCVCASVGNGQRTLYFSGHFDSRSGTEPGSVSSTPRRPQPVRAWFIGHEERPGGDDSRRRRRAMKAFSQPDVSASCWYPMKKLPVLVGRAI